MTTNGQTSRSTATRLNTTILAIAAVILIAIVGLSYREWTQYRRATGDATRAREVKDAVGGLVSRLLDAETGQRGFVLTGEARYLEPYNRAMRVIPTDLAKLNRLQSQGKLATAARLNDLVNQKLAELRRTIELRRSEGITPALNIVVSDHGEQVMDQIRSLGDEIQRREESSRIEASLARETAAQGALLVTAVGSLILLAFFIVGNRAINRAILARENALTEAQITRDSLKTTIASIGDAVISTDAQGRIVYANKVAQSLLRASETEVVGKHLDDVFRIVNEFTREKVESPVTKVLREGTIVGMANHTILIGQDGTETPIDDSGAPIRTEGGPIQGTVLVFRDITERRRAEATSRLLASIVESSTDAIYSKDLNGIVTSWNKGAERIFGYSAEEMIGHSISAIIPADRADETSAVLERVKKGERIDQYETTRRAKSGQLIVVSIAWSPVQDSLGRIVGASTIVRDMTLRKQAEERFHLAVEAAPNGMLVTDEAGKIILANSEMERLFGYSREEMIGQPVEFLAPRQIGDEHVQYRRSFYANPQARMMGEGRDLRARRKDGSEFPVEIALNPIETRHGRWVLSAIVDITERKRMEHARLELLAKERTLASERALRETQAELARIARALTVGELAASIAHEVNQPLAGVITNADACRRWLGGESPNLHEAQESLALIVRDGNRASEVIRRIREFLKKDTQEMASLDINEAIQEAIALARAEFTRSEVALRVELAPDLPLVRGDRIQLQQVILNLMMNGREAISSVTDGSRELLVTSRESAGPGGDAGVLVAVRDCGVGIKPQDMHRMFDAFFTTKAKGMGMGLSISRSIMEAHGGRIWAEANDGPGLTVQFTLPAESESQRLSVASSPS
jgi:two-component system, LuxR family, sensor kinase FixL